MAVLVPEQFKGWLSIPEATARMGRKHDQYTRRLVKDGKLRPSVKLDMGSHEKWFISPEACDNYMAQAASGNIVGGSGMRRNLFRYDPTLIDVARATALLAAEFGSVVRTDGSPAYTFGPQNVGKKSKSRKKSGETKEDWTARILTSLDPDTPNPLDNGPDAARSTNPRAHNAPTASEDALE